uniref:Uncharacterized protein n=1 Tax=Oryza glumipatula TaxID=40148 RepID=A0A0E0BJD7_9ORYZ
MAFRSPCDSAAGAPVSLRAHHRRWSSGPRATSAAVLNVAPACGVMPMQWQEFVRTVGVTYQEKLATARAAVSQCARSPKLNRPGDGEAVEGAHSELLARQEPMSPAVKLASGGWQSSVTSTPEPSSSR